ncbi:hypothetical protein M406DRAFT_75352 [Cryphonectria parasitica EP155]|uniref:Uncharacterized protein n=1 Tax=Cryphonectria parasitica (strain ATCC 38755 / EP155) TaxID=660469 RepID=A0A9P5CH56_CRYP1|nr:uncharacterized protein M406DRAFT_75352 [Cryphonectria parasitica EP155]KAF3759979.1 hypothetical protein M406DRAFT_75352 [Cryphonectria parasitica EP155]
MAPHISYTIDLVFRQERRGFFFCTATARYANILAGYLKSEPPPDYDSLLLCITIAHSTTDLTVPIKAFHSDQSSYHSNKGATSTTSVLVRRDKLDANALARNDSIGLVTAEKWAMYVVPWIEISNVENLTECVLRAELVRPPTCGSMRAPMQGVNTDTIYLVPRGLWSICLMQREHSMQSQDSLLDRILWAKND